jgi:hypothetical protein
MTTSPLHYLRYVILVFPQVLVTIGEAVHAIPVALAPPVLATVVAVVGALQDGRKKAARKAVTSAPAKLLPAQLEILLVHTSANMLAALNSHDSSAEPAR